MKIIGLESFNYTSKKDNQKHTCIKYYLASDISNDSHLGFHSIETGYLFDFSNDEAKTIKNYYDKGIEVRPLYSKRGNISELQEIKK